MSVETTHAAYMHTINNTIYLNKSKWDIIRMLRFCFKVQSNNGGNLVHKLRNLSIYFDRPIGKNMTPKINRGKIDIAKRGER